TDRPIVSTDGSKVSTDRQIEGTDEQIKGADGQIEGTDKQRKGTDDHTEEGSVTQTTQPPPTSTIFGVSPLGIDLCSLLRMIAKM
ncbi:hypothetical protein Tco_0512927, partial [Tanacetum coccineum]